ncbi:hypothetical protein FD754_009121 [Muntiacus muntjak]|uniref:JmjC domain-containing protein n=1 Tax=Muntiacus muntjak TaxID=9888 RepID=A0A5N3WW17_MUNMU|nr:hypothetical protein FD754_009121 [Muntiacus muntjak]
MDCSPPGSSVHGVFQARLLERKWQPTPVFLPGESHGWRSLGGCSPWGHKDCQTQLSNFTFTSRWTVDHLSQIRRRKEVKIHVAALVQSTTEENTKEFFISEDLLALIGQTEKTEKDDLGSPGEEPRKDLANIRKQFPLSEGDIEFPKFFKEWFFSSIKSEVLNIDNPDLSKYLLFSKARWYECSLKAGYVLFIPIGVGVNVFWKHLPSECYTKMDTYGDKDPTAASRAAQILDRVLKTLAELPEEYRDFHAGQMVLHIQDKAYSKNFE